MEVPERLWEEVVKLGSLPEYAWFNFPLIRNKGDRDSEDFKWSKGALVLPMCNFQVVYLES
jgi:hypothetical protein